MLCATTDRFQMTLPERAFFTGMGATMLGARGTVAGRGRRCAPSRAAARALDLEPRDIQEWALARVPLDHARGRSARPSPPSAGTTRGPGCARSTYRPRSSSTAATTSSRPPASSRWPAPIPGATIHDIDAGHAACVLETETFVPAFVEAVATVNARRRDFRSREQRDSTA